MRWLWFVASLLLFAIVFKTASIGLAVLCLLGALATLLIGVVALASHRIDARSRDASVLLGPDEIRKAREIDAKRRAALSAGAAPAASAASSGSDAIAPVAILGAGAYGLHAQDSGPGRHHDVSDSRDIDAGGGYDTGGSDGGGDGGGSGD